MNLRTNLRSCEDGKMKTLVSERLISTGIIKHLIFKLNFTVSWYSFNPFFNFFYVLSVTLLVLICLFLSPFTHVYVLMCSGSSPCTLFYKKTLTVKFLNLLEVLYTWSTYICIRYLHLFLLPSCSRGLGLWNGRSICPWTRHIICCCFSVLS